MRETSTLGAARAVGLVVGVWQSMDELRSLWAEDARCEPAIDVEAREGLLAQWRKAVARTFDWL